MKTPFLYYDGRWFVQPLFDRVRPSADAVRAVVDELLQHHAPRRVLVFRPLLASEVEIMRCYQRSARNEAFATICKNDQSRIGGRRLSD